MAKVVLSVLAHPDDAEFLCAGTLIRLKREHACDAIEGKDPLGRELPAGVVIDISGVIDTKAEMLARHASQRDWLLKHHGMDQYLEAMKWWSAHRGLSIGVKHAEAFRQHLGHS